MNQKVYDFLKVHSGLNIQEKCETNIQAVDYVLLKEKSQGSPPS